MNPQNITLHIIDRYIEQELLMASLYELFSTHYTVHKEFWSSMVSEEREHAAWIKHFKDGVMLDKIHFSEGKTRVSALDSSISYIKSIIQEFDKHPLDHLKAVSISHDIEKSLIERNVLRRFESDSDEVKKIMDILNTAQDEHIKKVEQFMIAARR